MWGPLERIPKPFHIQEIKEEAVRLGIQYIQPGELN